MLGHAESEHGVALPTERSTFTYHASQISIGIAQAANPCRRGSSSLSPNENSIVIYNIRDGVDVYAVKATGGGRRKPKRSFKLPKPARTNYAVQVMYVNDGRGVVCGTTTGEVCIWDTMSGEIYQTLAHERDDILQAVAVRLCADRFKAVLTISCQGVNRGGFSYIAAGSVDKGQQTYIKLWKAKYSEWVQTCLCHCN